jgi:hypothetical protein
MKNAIILLFVELNENTNRIRLGAMRASRRVRIAK